MTIRSGIFSGLLTGLRTSFLSKWGGGSMSGALTGSVDVSGDMTMNYLLTGALVGSSDTAGSMTGDMPGTLTGSVAVAGSFVAGGIDATIEGILTAADPMQELIDAMSFGTKPDYMWGGDEASGATEIGASGYDLTATGVDQEQTSAVLGSGDFCLFNANSDKLENTSDSALNWGAGSAAVLWIGSIDPVAATQSIVSNYDALIGWEVYIHSSDKIYLYVDTASGQDFLTDNTALTTEEAHCILFTRDITSLDADIHTKNGTANATIDNETIDPASVRFRLGQNAGVKNGFRGDWGICAVWKGSAAESLTKTHNDNLITFLGIS